MSYMIPTKRQLKNEQSRIDTAENGVQQQPIQGLQGTQQKRMTVSIDNINNIVTKYSFATKGGMSASNPYK